LSFRWSSDDDDSDDAASDAPRPQSTKKPKKCLDYASGFSTSAASGSDYEFPSGIPHCPSTRDWRSQDKVEALMRATNMKKMSSRKERIDLATDKVQF
jgi:hypothetical protein